MACGDTSATVGEIDIPIHKVREAHATNLQMCGLDLEEGEDGFKQKYDSAGDAEAGKFHFNFTVKNMSMAVAELHRYRVNTIYNDEGKRFETDFTLSKKWCGETAEICATCFLSYQKNGRPCINGCDTRAKQDPAQAARAYQGRQKKRAVCLCPKTRPGGSVWTVMLLSVCSGERRGPVVGVT